MMKNVLISAYTCCPNSGSEPGNGWNWLMGYVNNGFSVHCVTCSRHKTKIESYRKEKEIKNLIIYYTDNKVTLGFSRIPIFGLYIHYYIWLWAARKRIKKLIGETSFLHAHHVTYSSINLGTPIYNLNIRAILGPMGGSELPHYSLKRYLGRYFYFAYLKNNFSNLMARINPSVGLSIRSADMILTSNNIARQRIRHYTDKKTIEMFDAGLSDYFEKPFIKRTSSDKINLLWIGRILPRKGLNLAIEAIGCLPDNFDFHFTIVGDGHLKVNAKHLVQQSKFASRVTFLGRVPHESLDGIFRQSHILLFPSLIDSCPMQIFESFAFGLPVVTLDHQGMKEQVSETRGKKIRVGENINYPEELANAILSICESNDTYRYYSLNAYDFGQKQIWANRIKLFLNSLYE